MDQFIEPLLMLLFDFTLALKSAANILPSYTNITNDIVAVCYQGDYDDGYIETVKITITDTSATLKNIISKSGSYAIQGNKTVFKATFRTTSGDKTLTLPIHQGWNYLVFTYDHTRIKFFNNLTNVSLLCNENIQSFATSLIFWRISAVSTMNLLSIKPIYGTMKLLIIIQNIKLHQIK